MGSRDEDSNSRSEEYPANVLPSVPESTEPPHTTVTPSPLNDVSATPASPTKIPKETSAEPYRTRSGRAVNTPAGFADNFEVLSTFIHIHYSSGPKSFFQNLCKFITLCNSF